jgi:signal transduction histidine kinase
MQALLDWSTAETRVLILDPETGVRETLAAVLRNEGHAVRAAESVDEVRELLAEDAFDLALIDLYLSGDDGADPLAELRRLAPETIVIVLTGYATLESALRALHSGAYAYLVKPTDVEELRAVVARGLERRRLERELARRVRELEDANAAIHSFNAQLQAEVAAATEELRQKVHDQNATNMRLEQTQTQHQRFVAMVAHELRGPLALVMSYAQLAARADISREAVLRYTSLIVENAQRLNRLVEDLQTATRLSTGHFDLRRMPCDLDTATRATVDELRATTPDRTFSFSGDPSLGSVSVDQERVMQAVRNLLDNAIKYSNEGGAIETSVWAEGAWACVSVRDHGVGIPDADLERILKPFERGSDTGEIPGSGLGLFITRGIAVAHGGELRVHHGAGPERATGAVFTLVLPREQPDAPGELLSGVTASWGDQGERPS